MSRGFSFIEVLITTALFAVLVLAITQLYLVYGRVIVFQTSSIDVTLGGSYIIDATRTAGLQAKRIIATHAFPSVNLTSGTTTVIFELPAIDVAGAPIMGSYDYVGIYASSTNAYHLIDAAPGSSRISRERRLTGALGALSFVYDSPSFPSVTSVTVDATTSALVRGETVQMHLRGHVFLRNL